MEAGVFEDSFDEKMIYDDNMIFEIIDAACEVLGMCNLLVQSYFKNFYHVFNCNSFF